MRVVVETIGLSSPFTKSSYYICNIMPFVAAVTFVLYQKVCLLLDDIAEAAVCFATTGPKFVVQFIVATRKLQSKTQSKNQSIVQSIVQSRVQSPGFTPNSLTRDPGRQPPTLRF